MYLLYVIFTRISYKNKGIFGGLWGAKQKFAHAYLSSQFSPNDGEVGTGRKRLMALTHLCKIQIQRVKSVLSYHM